MFPQNVGTRDRDIRLILVGPLAVIALFFVSGIWTIVVGAIATILLLTSATGFCPLYTLLRVNTNESRPAAKH